MSSRALVTGAGRGIGRAIALRLAAEGHAVICSGRDGGALEQTVALVGRAGGEAEALALDLRDAAVVASGFVMA